MSNMPPPIPRTPRPTVRPSTPPQRPAPPARPHPGYMYEERRSSSSRSVYRATTPGGVYSQTRTTVSESRQSSSSSLGLSAGFASKARAALSSAGSYVASTASSVAAAAAGSGERERGMDEPGKKATWEEWARDWRDSRRSTIKGTETLYVVPGWAVKRPRADGGENAFDLHVSVSGFCNFVRDPGSTSRTQRAIIGIAKRFAALPQPPIVQAAVEAEELYESPAESPGLESFNKLSVAQDDKGKGEPRKGEAPPGLALQRRSTSEVFEDPQQLSAAHQLMDLRLAPFWSSVLAFRRVAISIYPVPLKRDDAPPKPDDALFAEEPLVRTSFTTNAQGHFSHTVIVPWERICTHPQSVPMAFADDPANDRTDWGVIVRAELLSEEGPNKLRQASGTADAFGPADRQRSRQAPGSHPSREPSGDAPRVPRRVSGANSFFSAAEEPNRNDGDGKAEMGLMGLGRTMAESWTVVDISRPGGIRIVSDLDDTVKHTDILSGTREVFRNVFCRDLTDSCVPGINELYTELHRLGLSGLHFVSNSPFELFPIVSEFLRLNNFPAYYSLKLKFYGGRSIVSSLFEGAGQRKRPSVVEILDEFYDSRFILIGDSGEQDLELYTSIARERPEQVAAIFIRDVTSRRVDELRAYEPSASASTSRVASGRASPTGTPPPPSRTTSEDDLAQTADELQQLSAAQTKLLRRAAEWDSRVSRAYDEIPGGVQLMFFEHVEEIEEIAKEIVRRGKNGNLHRPPPTPKAPEVGTKDGDLISL